jgi:membrane-bound lytic murein transglycosylase B
MRARGVTAAILTLLAAAAAGSDEPAEYRPAFKGFLGELTREGLLSRADGAAILRHARYRPEVIEAITRPYEAKPWYQYRALFLTPERIAQGATFWRANAASLKRAQTRYGVPPEVIVAILGVETRYGGYLGSYPVIDALSTLAFSYPPRSDFFRRQLKEFVLLTRDEPVDAFAAKGSYAGAMGKPQFIPSSYRAYAIDFDGDGRRDLWGSDADVIGSVAHYLASHGWEAGRPVAAEAQVPPTLPAGLPVTDKAPREPSIAPAALREAGVTTEEAAPAEAASLIRLSAPEEQYWLGFKNFYVITRYNHSNLYAMAVHQLSQEIKRLYEEPGRARVARSSCAADAGKK